MNLTTVNTISHDWSLSGPSWLFYSLLNHHSLCWTGLWPAVQIFQFPLIFMIIGRVIFLSFPILTHDVFSCSGKMATMPTFQCQNQTNAVLMINFTLYISSLTYSDWRFHILSRFDEHHCVSVSLDSFQPSSQQMPFSWYSKVLRFSSYSNKWDDNL